MQVPPLGVDLVEYSKTRAFCRRHSARLVEWLDRRELAYVRPGSAGDDRRLADVFAAKEAAFKSRAGAWMGPSGFSEVKLFFRKGLPVAARVGGHAKLRIDFRRRRDFVAAAASERGLS